MVQLNQLNKIRQDMNRELNLIRKKMNEELRQQYIVILEHEQKMARLGTSSTCRIKL